MILYNSRGGKMPNFTYFNTLQVKENHHCRRVKGHIFMGYFVHNISRKQKFYSTFLKVIQFCMFLANMHCIYICLNFLGGYLKYLQPWNLNLQKYFIFHFFKINVEIDACPYFYNTGLLKGLSHEIDFKNFDKKFYNLA